MNQRPRSDDLEATLGRVLGAGVTLSTVTLAAGLGSALLLGEVWWTTALLRAGVVLLIATPCARVLISSIAYMRRRDWLFAVLTAIVLLELLTSILAALLPAVRSVRL
jgi:uncharacterized membrane protein